MRNNKEIMYILSNGVKISEKMHQRLCEALKDTNQKRVYFLNINSGKLVGIPRAYRHKLEALKKESQKFIPLPKISEEEFRKRFVEFNQEMVDVPRLRARLSKEIKKGAPIKKLEKTFEKDPSGWIHGWVQDEQFLLAERIKEWITAPPLNARDDPDYWLDDNCPVCHLMRKIEEENRYLTTNEMKQAFKKAKEQGAWVGGKLLEESEAKKERKWMEEKGLKYIGRAKDFKMPKWMECTWRRVPCGKDDCPICGRIKRDRQRHIEKGEDPDDIKSVFEDVGRNFKEAMEMIKKEAERMGIDITNIEDIQEPPEPEEFPLYKKVMEWRNLVFEILESATQFGEFWVYTETFQDLSWYSNLLPAKIYRQLCNRWHIKEGDDYGGFDYEYTKYVISECLKNLKKSLKELSSFDSRQRNNSTLISNQLINLEKEILEI